MTRRSRKDGNIVEKPNLGELYEEMTQVDPSHRAEAVRKIWAEMLSICRTADTYCIFDHETHRMLLATENSHGEKYACVYDEYEVKDLYHMLKTTLEKGEK